MKPLVLASNNAGKLREFSALLAPLGWQVQPQSHWNVPEADEPHLTFVENALAKARHAAQFTGLPALADDSGICAPALDGAPGVHSARFAALTDGLPKSDERNNARLVELLRGQSDQRLFYVCVLVLVRHAADPQPLIAQANWWGTLAAQPAGTGGFGYDPYFYLPDLRCTAAELVPEQKNQISHRGQALRMLLQQLQHDVPPIASS
ncbi:MAG: RdgB/HAM1 family non-canonical purine NTP pyrophosphatase [Burkholderiaceae bacterium]|nr:MAG: RdgB/HAM1 family non-canonical purine NTP pyrophosphatase [Burkholderiaceae bacterium]